MFALPCQVVYNCGTISVKISLTELLWYNHAVLAFSTTTPGRRGGEGLRPNPTNLPWIRRWHNVDWLIEQGLTSHQTDYRSYRGRFLQVTTSLQATPWRHDRSFQDNTPSTFMIDTDVSSGILQLSNKRASTPHRVNASLRRYISRSDRDLDLSPLTLKTFSPMPVHVTNICGKCHWNPSTTYRAIASG